MSDPTPRDALEALAAEYQPPAHAIPTAPLPTAGPVVEHRGAQDVVSRCRAYLATVDPAVAGDNGSADAYRAARIIWWDWGLDEVDGYPLLEEYSARCRPPWSVKELRHKWDSATQGGPGPGGPRGFLAARDREDRARPTAGSGAAQPVPDRFPFITSAEFATGDYRPEWLIEGVLVKAQPGVIAGPSKTLKTGISIDAAISLASGTPLLGEFKVPKKTRTAIVSGESGPHTLQETARRICNARRLDFAALGEDLQWCFDLPTVSDTDGMIRFADKIMAMKAEVVFIDPLYLSLGAVDPKNLFDMGKALRAVGDVLLKAGGTPILVHHANGKLQTGEVMELQHLSYTGLEQYTRQFLLINRQTAYRGDGTHELWVSLGGSAGHGKLLSVTIDEGVINSTFAGRHWTVTVKGAGEAREDRAAARERAKADLARRKVAADGARVLEIIDAQASHGGATRTAIRGRTGWGLPRLNTAIAQLLEDGQIENVKITKPKGKGAGYTSDGFARPSE